MRVVLSIAALLLVAVNVASLVPQAAMVRPYQADASIALGALIFLGLLLMPRRAEAPRPAEPRAEPARPPAPEPVIAAAQPPRADADVVAFLAMLQEKGRLVDFLMDDINPYPDAQVGAAARVVHAGCKSVLGEHFQIQPIREEQEGATVQVPAGYAADEYRLVGKVAGQAPFSGTLVHRGWKTTNVKLPQLLRTATDPLPAIAPAEVELK